MTEQDKVDKALELIRKYVPETKVSFKSDSKLHKAIDKLLKLLGNSRYLSECWTTLHTWMARPVITQETTYLGEWQIMLHEGRHALDSKKLGAVPFGIVYLCPQFLSILGFLVMPLVLLGIVSTAWWWVALFLVCLAPVPAVGRAIIELRAYKVSLLTAYWANDLPYPKEYIEAIAETLAGPVYYWMWPFKTVTKEYLSKQLDQAIKGASLNDPYLEDCKALSLTLKET